MSDELIETGAAEAAPQPVTIVEPEAKTINDTMGEVWEKLNKTDRAENGQFKSKAAPTESAPKVSEKEAVAETVETPKASIPRPQSYSADVDEWWSSLPPERQEFLAKREGETHSKITQLGEIEKAYKQQQAVFERYQHLVNQGTTREQEIEMLLSTKQALLRDPVGSLQRLAQQLNVDLSQFGRQQQAQQSTGDERLDAILQQLNSVQQNNAQLQNQLNQRFAQEEQSRLKSVESLVEKFAKDKEHWSELESQIQRQIHALKLENPNADPMETLKEAYETAVKLTPSVLEKVTAKEKEEAAKKTAAESKKRADEAKRLATLNVKSSSGSSPKAASKDMYEEMREVYDRIHATG